jgi:hypothetical protein
MVVEQGNEPRFLRIIVVVGNLIHRIVMRYEPHLSNKIGILFKQFKEAVNSGVRYQYVYIYIF